MNTPTPTEGGSYRINEAGELELVQRTQPLPVSTEETSAPTSATPEPAAPAVPRSILQNIPSIDLDAPA